MNVTHTSVGLAVVSLTCAHDGCLNHSVALKGDAVLAPSAHLGGTHRHQWD